MKSNHELFDRNIEEAAKKIRASKQIVISHDDEIEDHAPDVLEPEMILDDPDPMINPETGEIMDEAASLSAEDYVLTKLDLCRRFYRDGDICMDECPLERSGRCMHADIDSRDDFRACETAIARWLNDRTVGNVIRAMLADKGIELRQEYLSEEGKRWLLTRIE